MKKVGVKKYGKYMSPRVRRELMPKLKVKKLPWAEIDRKFIDMALEATRQGYEVAVGVRRDGSYEFIKGWERGVNLAIGVKDVNYLYTIHTHPGNTPHSVKDILGLVINKTILASIVVMENGEIWAVRKTPRTISDSEEIYRLYNSYRDFEQESWGWQSAGIEYAESLGMDVVLLETYGEE